MSDEQDLSIVDGTEEEEVEIEESPPSSPTTKNFVEESLAKGLPIIPFNYPTFVIVEKKISDARASHHQAAPPLPGPPLFSSWGASEKTVEEEMRSVSAPNSRKTSKREGRLMGMGQSVDDKSLSSVVSMAKQEMEEEKQEGSVRKVRPLITITPAIYTPCKIKGDNASYTQMNFKRMMMR